MTPSLTSIANTNQGEQAAVLPMLVRQTSAEFLKLWRTPAFSLSSLALPIIFFAFFGLPNSHYRIAGVSAGPYLLASFGAYGTTTVMLFSFGVGVAVERGQKMTVLMRVTPLPGVVALAARVITAVVFASIMLSLLFAFGVLAGGIHMASTQWITLTVRLLLGALPFIAMGLSIGYLASPAAAAPIANILFLVLSFGSGLFVPLSQLPSFVRQAAPYLPTYHYGQLVWQAVGAQTDSMQTSIVWLAGYGLAFASIAIWAYQREEQASFH